MIKNKVPSKQNKQLNWWIIIMMIIWGIMIFVIFVNIISSSDNPDRYCIDNCISHMDYCAVTSYIAGQSLNFYLSDSDYDECRSELESCISDC